MTSSAVHSHWPPFTVGPTVNHAPVVTTNTVNTTPGQTLSLFSLVAVSDSDADAMTRYQLYDSSSNPLSGHFEINGIAQPSRQVIDITATQLSQTTFVTGTATDVGLQIRAFDGQAWSAPDSGLWAPFQVNVS